MKKTVLNTALSTAFIFALGFSVSACSGDKEGESHEILAKDRVDEASELARKNAPAAEEMDFPETAPMPVTEADGTVVEGAETDGTMMTTEEGTADAGMAETTATDGTDTDAAVANGTETPAADTAATEAEAEPATN